MDDDDGAPSPAVRWEHGEEGDDDDDDSVPAVGGRGGGDDRAPTPGKDRPRAVTPSALARQKSAQLLRAQSQISRATGSRGRVVGRRRQRRWNNDNFFKVEGGRTMMEVDPEDAAASLAGPPVLWKNTAVEELVDNGTHFDPALRESIRRGCMPAEPSRRCTSRIGGAHPDGCGKALEEEVRFRRLPKRLRDLLLNSVVQNEKLFSIMQGLEVMLKTRGRCLNLEGFILTRPLEHLEGGKCARVHLKDSPFYRLLLHGTCAFFGAQSKSEDVSDPPQRVVRIYWPLDDAQASSSISITSFLLRSSVNKNRRQPPADMRLAR